MPLETATYVTDLVSSNPAHTDGLSQADSHMRLLKSCIKATFPNFTSAALSSTQAELDAAAHTGQLSAQNGSSGAPSITFKNDATAGFYKGALTGQTAIAGTLRGKGAMPVGAIVDFPKAPTNLGTEWLECDGSTPLIATYPDLAAFLGTTFGGNGTTTFGLPNLSDTGRFRRSRSASVGAGGYQSNAFKTHVHTASTSIGTAGAHSHNASVSDPGHTHTVSAVPNAGSVADLAQGASGGASQLGAVSTAFTGIGVSLDTQGDHTHSATTTITASSDGGTTETRPEAFAVYACIKT